MVDGQDLDVSLGDVDGLDDPSESLNVLGVVANDQGVVGGVRGEKVTKSYAGAPR